jgi:tetratricopeptide (TPR) repeat protein
MKRFAVLVIVLFCGLASALAQGLDDEYVQIFKTIQEADSLSSAAPAQALTKYLDAQAALDRLHKGSPDWNTRIVTYRLSYLADRIAALSPTTSLAAPGQTNEVKAAQPAPALAPADWQGQSTRFQQHIAQLQADNDLLQAKLKEALAVRPAAVDPAELARAQDRIKSLEKENELLKVSRENQSPGDAKSLEDTRHSLADANRRVSEQEARLAKLSLEKEALESRLKHLSEAATETKPVIASSGDNAQLKELERERDELQRRLDNANKELSSRKKKGGTARGQEENELAAARARLEVLEARATPYSQEELALLKTPETKLTAPNAQAAKKSIKELPPGAATQVAEAQRYFAAKEYDKAEAAYQDVLRQAPKNIAALGNLAVIQLEAHHFDQAESNIQQALALDPEDSYSLYVLGLLRLRENKYDDALGALSRAAKLDPNNAEVQNYLGLALSEKGMRAPAEAALRKAVQLQPGYAGAQYNLAVVYATQQPPATELARFHYQKALAAGLPRNPDLEKRFEVRP